MGKEIERQALGNRGPLIDLLLSCVLRCREKQSTEYSATATEEVQIEKKVQRLH